MSMRNLEPIQNTDQVPRLILLPIQIVFTFATIEEESIIVSIDSMLTCLGACKTIVYYNNIAFD